ncbi:MAG: hypothetical protein ACX939_00690, partial [Hyphococcus sp.]
AIDAATAFETAGRCVYFHNTIVTDLLAPHIGDRVIHSTPLWAGRERFPGDARLGFFTLRSQFDQCAF